MFLCIPLLVTIIFVDLLQPLSCLDATENSYCSSQIFAEGSGVIKVPLEKSCKVYKYVLHSRDQRSIISMATAITVINATLSKNGFCAEEDNVTVSFREWTNHADGRNESIVMATWLLTPMNATTRLDYLSRSSTAKIDVSAEGTWINYEILFQYQEFKFEIYKDSSNASKGELMPWIMVNESRYRPNCVTVYTLNRSSDLNISSISLTVHYLDIDFGVGEYLLIGAGREPFKGPPPLFIASGKSMKKYSVNDENAYIVFVSGSTRNRRKGFKISWQHTGTKISEINDKVVDPRGEDVLQSVPICFYNATAALREFNISNKEDIFIRFREKLAKIARKYAEDKKLKAKYYNIKASSIKLYRISGIIPLDNKQKDDHDNSALCVMMKVKGSEEGKAAFSWQQLEEIIDLFEKNDSDLVLGYKVGKCPPDVSYDKWWSIGIYASVPVFCVLFVLMWAWRQKLFLEYCLRRKNKREKGCFEQVVRSQDSNSAIGQNEYVSGPTAFTIPKVLLSTISGRRYTLDPRNSFAFLYKDEDEDDISVTSDCGRPEIRNIKESRSIRNPLKNGLERPSLHSVVNSNGECSCQLEPEETVPKEIIEQESEHVYDSVSSASNTLNDKGTAETKL